MERELRINHHRSTSEVTTSMEFGNGELEIEIFPTSDGKNIGEIIGKMGNHKCEIGAKELHKLPLIIEGSGMNLSERVKCKLAGTLDPDGSFQLFLNGFCTTLVQFKLSGKLFPQDLLKENSKTGKLNPELFTKAVFQKLANYKTNDPQLRTYISKMTNFWNNYHHFFTNMNIELETLRQEIITVKTENQQLRQEITNIKKYLKI